MRWVAVYVSAIAVCGCKAEGQDRPESGRAEVAADSHGDTLWYRCVIIDPPGEVPFLISLPRRDGPGTAEIANADERLRQPARRDGNHVVVEFPEFGNRLELELGPGDRIAGTWNAEPLIGASLRVSGTRIAGPDPALRFPSSAAPAVDVSGVWELDISEVGAGKAWLRQRKDGVVDGTLILGDLGDARFLAGRVVADTLALTTFDGMRAIRIDARVSEDGTRMEEGTGRYAAWYRYTFTGKRGRDIPATALQRGRLRAGQSRVTLPELADPRLVGKPVVVNFFGTWCSTCKDLTPALVDAYRRHHEAGLEVVAIALEPYAEEFGRERIAAFRSHYDVPFAIVQRPVTEGADLMTELPPEIENVKGFPVTLFFDRDHSLRAIRAGFVSKASPDDHRAVLADFDALVAAIVSSPAP